MPFTRTWDVAYEANPAGSQAANQGDDRIRELKTDTRERGNLEHDWGTVGATDTGRHKFPVGAQAVRDAITDLIANGQIFFRTDRPGLDIRLTSAWVEQFFYAIATTAARTALTGVDKGYIAFDTDLDEFFYGDGAGGWRHLGGNIDVQVTAATVAEESPGATGTWTDITGLTKGVLVPNDGVDYLIVAIAVVKHHDLDANNVLGFRLLEDAVVRDIVTSRGDNLPINSSVVMHVKTDPVNNTTYTFKVQMDREAPGAASNLLVNPTDTLAGVAETSFSKLITALIRKAV